MSHSPASLEKTLGYRFKEPHWLLLALTHSSFGNEISDCPPSSNERLEFLGDSILSLIISEFLYSACDTLAEGDLSRIRAALVCEKSLCQIATDLHLGKFLRLGKGEERSGGRQRASVLADAVEALIAALYLDQERTIAGVRPLVMGWFEPYLEQAIAQGIGLDYKSKLQEKIQKTGAHKIHYEVIQQQGPDHSKSFCSQVLIDNQATGRGWGKSKKESEQQAAKAALESS